MYPKFNVKIILHLSVAFISAPHFDLNNNQVTYNGLDLETYSKSYSTYTLAIKTKFKFVNSLIYLIACI